MFTTKEVAMKINVITEAEYYFPVFIIPVLAAKLKGPLRFTVRSSWRYAFLTFADLRPQSRFLCLLRKRDCWHAFLPFLLAKKESTGIIYTGSHLSIIPAFNLPAYSASKAALNAFVQCLRYQLFLAKANVNGIELSPPAVQTELHDATMGERGRSFGMPLDVFTEEAYKGLASGRDQVFIGTVGPQKEGQKDTFMELVDNRQKLFKWLSGVMAAYY
ncbi:uncharacterized protein FRV6_02774 [Fusarium oxysporum]|uniref:Uncharacterized protein n=1 Tax=Fusarium oxysporum TaxID=5507 RepID=A0A2H3SQX4_FUSOX|nr:uncharacterized protein FRV6_02774 [Fusarium oxysporum]